MKLVKLAASLFALSALSFGAVAAEEAQFANGQEVKTITASSYVNLDDVVAQLSAKADAAGGKSFRIINVNNGDNLIHATAVVYK